MDDQGQQLLAEHSGVQLGDGEAAMHAALPVGGHGQHRLPRGGAFLRLEPGRFVGVSDGGGYDVEDPVTQDAQVAGVVVRRQFDEPLLGSSPHGGGDVGG